MRANRWAAAVAAVALCMGTAGSSLAAGLLRLHQHTYVTIASPAGKLVKVRFALTGFRVTRGLTGSLGPIHAPRGDVFVVLSMNLDNLGTAVADTSPALEMYLTTKSGTRYKPDLTADIQLPTSLSQNGSLQPHIPLRAEEVFAVPSGAKGLVFVYSTFAADMGSGTPVQYRLPPA